VSDAPGKLRPVTWESGVEVKPVYGPDDLRGVDVGAEVGAPGEFPFTRGIHRAMYRARPWTMRQYLGFGSPEETNARFRYLVSCGQDALNVAFDLPTQMGLDSDDPLAAGEVGRVGMAVDTLADFELAFRGLPLGDISVSLTINAVAAIFICMYEIVCDRMGLPKDRIRGTTQNDILKEYVARGTWIYPVEPSLRLTVDTMEYCAKHLPRYNPVSVCGYHIREAGADCAREIAYALEIAREYLARAVARGLDVNAVAAGITYNFDVFGNLWENVAKFRAGRRLWAEIVKQEFGATDPKAMMFRMIAGGGGGGLIAQEPENNIVRGAYYALASALGGAQTMALCCWDEGHTIPSAAASKLSLRTMQILAEEIGLCDTVDPLGGSWFVEATTHAMAEKIQEHRARVARWGGIVGAVESGALQREVAELAHQAQLRLERGDDVKVGLNKFVDAEVEAKTAQSARLELYRENAEALAAQRARTTRVRAERDGARAEAALAALEAACRGTGNLMYPLKACVEAYCTVGEMARTMKKVFGEFREPTAV
jgi:methylmalonyl-CoA mutase N-terminal domain/subunit